MNEEIMAVRSWVWDALKCAVNARNKKRKVSKYERGRIAGLISAYQHVMVETSHAAARKMPFRAVERAICDVTSNTSLTLSDAIGICYFHDSNDMRSMTSIADTVIGLWRSGYDSHQIKSVLGRKVVRNEKWDSTIVWERRKRDE